MKEGSGCGSAGCGGCASWTTGRPGRRRGRRTTKSERACGVLSRLPRPFSEKGLDPPRDAARIAPLAVLAREHGLLIGKHDEERFRERRGHPRRAYQGVVPAP